MYVYFVDCFCCCPHTRTLRMVLVMTVIDVRIEFHFKKINYTERTGTHLNGMRCVRINEGFMHIYAPTTNYKTHAHKQIIAME